MASSVVAILAPCDEMNRDLLKFTTVYKDATEALGSLLMSPILQDLQTPVVPEVLPEDASTGQGRTSKEQGRNPRNLIQDLEAQFRACASNEIQIVSSITSYVQTLESTLMMGKSGPDLAAVLNLMLQMNLDQSADNAASRKKDLKDYQEALKAIQNTVAELDNGIERLDSKFATRSKDIARMTLFEAIRKSLVDTVALATDARRAKIQLSAFFELPLEALDEKLEVTYTSQAKENAVSSSLDKFRSDLGEIHTGVEMLLRSLKNTTQLAQALAGMWNNIFGRLKGLETVAEPVDPALASEVATSWSTSCITAESFVTAVTGVMEQKSQKSAFDEMESSAPLASDPSTLTMLNLESEADVRA